MNGIVISTGANRFSHRRRNGEIYL